MNRGALNLAQMQHVRFLEVWGASSERCAARCRWLTIYFVLPFFFESIIYYFRPFGGKVSRQVAIMRASVHRRTTFLWSLKLSHHLFVVSMCSVAFAGQCGTANHILDLNYLRPMVGLVETAKRWVTSYRPSAARLCACCFAGWMEYLNCSFVCMELDD